jgi:hypothetical protein
LHVAGFEGFYASDDAPYRPVSRAHQAHEREDLASAERE